MADVQKLLQKEGWFVTPDAIQKCSEGKKRATVDNIINSLLKLDLRGLSVKTLPEKFSKSQVIKVPYPLVLQVMKITNISAPTYNPDSSVAPPLLRLQLTDGCTSCAGLVVTDIPGLSLNMTPGTKICIIGEVQVQHGILKLTKKNTKLLGGDVESLVKRSKAKQNIVKSSVNVEESSGPPPFIPYQDYISNRNRQLIDNTKGESRHPAQAMAVGNDERNSKSQQRNYQMDKQLKDVSDTRKKHERSNRSDRSEFEHRKPQDEMYHNQDRRTNQGDRSEFEPHRHKEEKFQGYDRRTNRNDRPEFEPNKPREERFQDYDRRMNPDHGKHQMSQDNLFSQRMDQSYRHQGNVRDSHDQQLNPRGDENQGTRNYYQQPTDRDDFVRDRRNDQYNYEYNDTDGQYRGSPNHRRGFSRPPGRRPYRQPYRHDRY